MVDCPYCEASFAGDEAYLRHLGAEHWEDLDRIERRRVQSVTSNRDRPVALYAVVAGGVILFALLAYGLYSAYAGGGGSTQPYAPGSVHYHGPMTMVVDGQQVDFSQPQYQYGNTGNQHFHFEGGDGSQWHVHSRGVTLGYATSTLGIDVTRETVTFEGTTYRESDPDTNVSVTVNGRAVTPSEYVLQEGDRVRIVVERGGGSGNESG